MRRPVVGLLAAATLLAAGWAAPASAADDGCTGVWVVVDATALGGTVTTACAPDHATGTQALASAGVDVERSAGMVCRLDGLPSRCEVSASAYWTYWQATPAGDGYSDWTYATLGADAYRPAPGDAEGWRFGDGSAPPAELPGTLAVAGPADAPAVATAPPEAPSGSGGPLGALVVIGVVALAGAAAYVARRGRG